MADHRGKFLFFSVSATGSFPDSSALSLTSLCDWISGLAAGYYVLADNAYVLTETLLIPFSASQRNNPAHSCYNFLLSQLRIRVEQAFGLFFSTKWRIFRKQVAGKLLNTSQMLKACSRLHNFVIERDWDEAVAEESDTSEFLPSDLGPLVERFFPILTEFRAQPGNSFLQDRIVEYIEQNGFRRPC